MHNQNLRVKKHRIIEFEKFHVVISFSPTCFQFLMWPFRLFGHRWWGAYPLAEMCLP